MRVKTTERIVRRTKIVEAGQTLDVDVAEAKRLIAQGVAEPIGPSQETEPPLELTKLTKEQLVEYGGKRGLTLDVNVKKEQLLEALTAL